KQEQPKVSLKYPESFTSRQKAYSRGRIKALGMISGVHYAPEITLNILSLNLLQHQGFEIILEGDKCILEYMFKDKQGQNLDNDEIVSKGWDTYRERFDKVLKWFYNHYLKRQLPGPVPPIIHGVQIYLSDLYKLVDCVGAYLSVNFGQEFDVIAEILGLTKRDGDEIKRCYISYLDVFTSYYKTARAPQIPTKVEEASKSLVSYQWNMDRTCTPKAVQKGKEKLEHFRIKLEDETDCNIQQTTHYKQDKDTICKRPSTFRII
nr:ARID DNA-binding domain-containing protein [Tanacetum cinerariifolium]